MVTATDSHLTVLYGSTGRKVIQTLHMQVNYICDHMKHILDLHQSPGMS
jgi:hypothetical protein